MYKSIYTGEQIDATVQLAIDNQKKIEEGLKTTKEYADSKTEEVRVYVDENDEEIKQTVQNLDKRIFNNKNLLQTEWTGTIEASDEEMPEYIVLDAITYPIDTQVTLSIRYITSGETNVLGGTDLLSVTFYYTDGSTHTTEKQLPSLGSRLTYPFEVQDQDLGTCTGFKSLCYYTTSSSIQGKTVSKIAINKLAWSEPIKLMIQQMQVEVTPTDGSGYYTDYQKYESPTFATPNYVKGYADEKDTEMLEEAKRYARSAGELHEQVAKDYADRMDEETLKKAEEYDEEVRESMSTMGKNIETYINFTLKPEMQSYADEKDAENLRMAQMYADTKDGNLYEAAKAYTDGYVADYVAGVYGYIDYQTRINMDEEAENLAFFSVNAEFGSIDFGNN